MFTLTADVEETSTRSEDISLDYDFFHSDLLEISCGGNYTAKVIPKDINIWLSGCSLETRTAFPSSTTRTWIPWSTGQTRRRTAGSSGGCVCGLWAGGYAAVGMAAETDRIYLRKSDCLAERPLFSYTKPMRRYQHEGFWTGIQLSFSALGGWLGWFLGGMDGLLYRPVAFVLVDYITGVMCAIADKKLSSAGGLQGHLPEGADLPAGGHCHILDVQVLGHRSASHGGDLLLPIQRGHEPFWRTRRTWGFLCRRR